MADIYSKKYYRVPMILLRAGGYIGSLCLSFSALALPETCLQLPERTQACPHLIYKKSTVAVQQTATKINDIICICLSDFESLLHQAETKVASTEQQVELNRAAQKLAISEQDLLTLLRK